MPREVLIPQKIEKPPEDKKKKKQSHINNKQRNTYIQKNNNWKAQTQQKTQKKVQMCVRNWIFC